MAVGSASRATVREPLWTRNYVLTLLTMHLFFLAWSMLFSTLPLYLEDARKWQVGWVAAGAMGVASLAARPWSGRVVDRTGRWWCLVGGAICTGVLMAAHALTADPLLLTPIRILYGVATAFYTTAGMAMLADVLPTTRRGEGMGWYGVFYTATNVYGPWLGLTLAQRFGLRGFFLWGGGVLFLCALAAAGIREERRPATTGAKNALFSRAAFLPTGSFLTLTIAFSVLPAFLVLYVRDYDLGNAGIFFVLMGLALVAARGGGGYLADRLGRRAVILPGFVLGTAGMALLAAAQGPAMLYAAAAVFGTGFGLGHTGLTIATVDRAPAAERGAAMATFVLAWDIGTLGAFLLGFVADQIGLRALYSVAACLPLAGLCAFELLRGRSAPGPLTAAPSRPLTNR